MRCGSDPGQVVKINSLLLFVQLDLIYGKGISIMRVLLDLAVSSKEIIQKVEPGFPTIRANGAGQREYHPFSYGKSGNGRGN